MKNVYEIYDYLYSMETEILTRIELNGPSDPELKRLDAVRDLLMCERDEIRKKIEFNAARNDDSAAINYQDILKYINQD